MTVAMLVAIKTVVMVNVTMVFKAISKTLSIFWLLLCLKGIPDGVNIADLSTTTVLGDLQKWTDEQFDNKAPVSRKKIVDGISSFFCRSIG